MEDAERHSNPYHPQRQITPYTSSLAFFVSLISGLLDASVLHDLSIRRVCSDWFLFVHYHVHSLPPCLILSCTLSEHRIIEL